MRRQIDLPRVPDLDPYRDPLALAVVSEVFERGGDATAVGVIARAEVSAEEFAERYATVDDCALDAYERFIAVFKRRVGGAFNAYPDWRSSLRASAYETADWITENLELCSFGNTGVLQMKNEILRVRREEVFVFCAQLIDLGRTEPGSLPNDGSAAVYAIGSITQLLTNRLQVGVDPDPHKIVPEMMYSIVRVYLGDEAADEELVLPRPTA
jgi:hypothetical protein